MKRLNENFKLTLALLLTICTSCCAQNEVRTEETICISNNDAITVSYYNSIDMSAFKSVTRVDNWYSKLTIRRGNTVIRDLDFENSNDILQFQKSDGIPFASKNCKYMFIDYVSIGLVEEYDNDPNAFVHDVYQCEIISLKSGNTLYSFTGQACGGSFSKDDKWVDGEYVYELEE